MRNIRVSKKVLEGLEAIRKSGSVKPCDAGGAQRIAREMGLIKTMKWIQQHRQQYQKGMMVGFECESS